MVVGSAVETAALKVAQMGHSKAEMKAGKRVEMMAVVTVVQRVELTAGTKGRLKVEKKVEKRVEKRVVSMAASMAASMVV